MPVIKALAHICFTVSDLQASLDFYQDKLGFAPAKGSAAKE